MINPHTTSPIVADLTGYGAGRESSLGPPEIILKSKSKIPLPGHPGACPSYLARFLLNLHRCINEKAPENPTARLCP
jgi:hypothetical protein